MHCAEKKKYPRYLSAAMMSRTQTLGTNVKVFLREKLPKYNIGKANQKLLHRYMLVQSLSNRYMFLLYLDLDFMFEVRQDNCDQLAGTMNMKDYYDKVLKFKESNEIESAENLK
jgi:hypothetical protein